MNSPAMSKGYIDQAQDTGQQNQQTESQSDPAKRSDSVNRYRGIRHHMPPFLSWILHDENFFAKRIFKRQEMPRQTSGSP
jgi:hypothetical protein